MNDTILNIENLTKDYGKGRGIFDLNFEVKKGETFGFIGTNGSGKTTTIRNMMSFIHPDYGSVDVKGYDAWNDSIEIKNYVSYVPGEINFPPQPTGTAFLKSQADMLGVKDFEYMNHLIRLFQLDPSANLKRMSKGMKQKTAIVAALMADKEILIMDEPTTGLDPLMRDVFLDLMREEKKKGKTIFMSSQILDEIEEICDRVAVINNGYIIGILNAWDYRHEEIKEFEVEFESDVDAKTFGERWMDSVQLVYKKVIVSVRRGDEEKLLNILRGFEIVSLHENHKNLADAFKELYISQGKKGIGYE